MNGGQDLGGMMGFGPIAPEAGEPVFHAEWERRAFGLVQGMGLTEQWSLDAVRHARESMPPATYLASSYYEIWCAGLTKLLLAHDLVSIHELSGDSAILPGRPLKRVSAQELPSLLAAGTPYTRPGPATARFAIGDAVRAKNQHKLTHTRLPRYVRGRAGSILSINGIFVFPDSNADCLGEQPGWLYTVRFSGRELWGEAADPDLVVMLDLWEAYLDPA